MTSMRQAIERDRALRKIRKPGKMLVACGKTFTEKSTANSLIWCPNCTAAVVNSQRAKENHAQRMPQCRKAMGLE